MSVPRPGVAVRVRLVRVSPYTWRPEGIAAAAGATSDGDVSDKGIAAAAGMPRHHFVFKVKL